MTQDGQSKQKAPNAPRQLPKRGQKFTRAEMLRCECGCSEKVISFNARPLVIPGFARPPIIRADHVRDFLREHDRLLRLQELVSTMQPLPFWERIRYAGDVYRMAYAIRIRTQGHEIANREALRTSRLSWLPRWIARPLAKLWKR